jgi:hypothetical protein
MNQGEDIPVGTTVQAVERLRHVQDQDIQLEHSIRNHKVVEMNILRSGHNTPSVER